MSLHEEIAGLKAALWQAHQDYLSELSALREEVRALRGEIGLYRFLLGAALVAAALGLVLPR